MKTVIRHLPAASERCRGTVIEHLARVLSLLILLAGLASPTMADLSFSPASVAFGDRPIGIGAWMGAGVTVINAGSESLTIAYPQFVPNGSTVNPSAGLWNSSPTDSSKLVLVDGQYQITLAVGEAITFDLFYIPTLPLFQGTSLVFRERTTQAIVGVVPVSGRGIGVAPVEIIPDSVTFAGQALSTTAFQSVTVHNTHPTEGVFVGFPTFTGAHPGDFSGPTPSSGFNTTIQPGEYRTIQVGFSPSAVGNRSAEMRFFVPILNSLSLSGTGLPDNSPPSANAGPDQTVTVTGAATLVGPDGSQSSDPDGDPLTYTWTEGTTVLGTGATLSVGLSPGTHLITLTVDDGNGASDTDQVEVKVIYSWSGVLPPINPDGSSIFKLGRTVPVKFQLTGASASITDAVARLYVTKISDGVAGTEAEAESTAAADSGNTFRYDSSAGQYIFNLGTESLSEGTWQLRIDLGDGTTNTVLISLRD